jgi:catechol 2,3-dioxygenase-like lactoylglutathione lyase family enzyme
MDAHLRVNHIAIAVRDMTPALAFFQRHFPITEIRAHGIGHTGDYRWSDFLIGDFKLELIESAAPGSFVEHFLVRRGEGLHHLSLEAPDFDRRIAAFERDGLRIVDRFEVSPTEKTAFISPRSAFGTLIQFWSAFDEQPERPRVATHVYGGTPARMRVNHIAIAVRDIERALGFFERHFPITLGTAPRVGYEPSFCFTDFTIAGYKIELIAENPAGLPGFLRPFLEKRGEGFHHLSIDVDTLAPVIRALEADGVRMVDRFRSADGHETAFISPRSAFGVLIQFWEHPEGLPAS